MKLSHKAWLRVSKIIEAIKSHPFNQELMLGTLDEDKFAFYIEQDSLYLNDFARSLATISSKIDIEYVRNFLKYSDQAFIAEQEVVHTFFKKKFRFKETGFLTPATLSYTSYLLKTCSSEPVEVAVAVVLPCFWVYMEVGLFISSHANKNNPYIRWIETYAGEDFAKSVHEAIEIFDKLAEKASLRTQEKMLDAFYKSTCLEWHFWNDAYFKKMFDNVC